MEKNSTTLLLIGIIVFVIVIGVLFGDRIINPRVNNKQGTLNSVQEDFTPRKTTTQNKNINMISKKYNEITSFIMDKLMKLTVLQTLEIMLAITIIWIILFWMIYKNNGQPGWASLIPLYRRMILYRIVKIDEAFAFFIFVPIAGIIIDIALFYYAMFLLIVEKYGKRIRFFIGFIFFPIIFLLVIAFQRQVDKNTIFYNRNKG